MPSQQQKQPQPEQPRPEKKPADYEGVTVDPVDDLLAELAKIQEEDAQMKQEPDTSGCGCAGAAEIFRGGGF